MGLFGPSFSNQAYKTLTASEYLVAGTPVAKGLVATLIGVAWNFAKPTVEPIIKATVQTATEYAKAQILGQQPVDVSNMAQESAEAADPFSED